ncbi:putative signal peptide protein, partial [Puccinia sorghi]
MRFFALLTLLALFLIQSQTAHADFMCNDGRYPDAKVGYCAILDPQGPKCIVKVASVVNQVSRTFTCSQTTILNRAPSWRWCCSKSPAPYSTSLRVDPL